MDMLIKIVNSNVSGKVKSVKSIGQGAVGTIYLCEFEENSKRIAVKFSEKKEIMDAEVKNIKFISERVNFKLPKIEFSYTDNDKINLVGMEYFAGKNANERQFLRMPRAIKDKFATQVVENLIRLQCVENDMYGEADNPTYDSWLGFYKPFAYNALLAAEKAYRLKDISKFTYKIMSDAYNRFDMIFDEPVTAAVLTHGDYWLPNIIVAEQDMELLGVVDPFNLLYADKEYDLFPLIAANGNKYGLLDKYKSLTKTSEKCDLKLEFYALFSELYWYTKTENISKAFASHKAHLLKKMLKKFNINM